MKQVVIWVMLWLWPAAVWAEREVHVVSVAVGWEEPGTLLAVPSVPVHIDRPGAQVTLVALSRSPLRWDITVSDGTELARVVLSAPMVRQSEVTFRAIPLPVPDQTSLGAVLDPMGSEYRDLVADLTRVHDVPALASFQGRYAGTASGFLVNTAGAYGNLAPDYLAEAVGDVAGAEDVVWDVTAPAPAIDGDRVIWDGQVFAPPEGVPPVRFAMDAVYDAQRSLIYLLSLGGAGFVYAVDPESGGWSVLHALEGYDGARLMLDAPRDRLILTGAFGRPGEVRIVGLDGSVDQFKLSVFEFPGLTDLYAFGRDHPVPLDPVAVADGWLFVQAKRAGTQAYRRYAIHLERHDVVLLDYGDG